MERVEDGGGWLKERSEEKRRKLLERARIRGRANWERKKRGKGEEMGVWRDMKGVEVEEMLKEEVKKAVRDRERFERGGKLKGGGIRKDGDKGGREGRRVLREVGNI